MQLNRARYGKLFTIVAFISIFLSDTAFAANTYFNDWPQDKSPQQVGLLVANAFVKREHFIHPDNNAIHYAEAVAWCRQTIKSHPGKGGNPHSVVVSLSQSQRHDHPGHARLHRDPRDIKQ